VLPNEALSDNLLGLPLLSWLHRFEYSDGNSCSSNEPHREAALFAIAVVLIDLTLEPAPCGAYASGAKGKCPLHSNARGSRRNGVPFYSSHTIL